MLLRRNKQSAAIGLPLMSRFNNRRLKITRDSVIFLIGIGGIVHETFFTKLDRPDILVLFMAMVGLPAFLRTDEGRKQRRLESGQPPIASEQDPEPPIYRTRPPRGYDRYEEYDESRRYRQNPPRAGEYDDLDEG